MRTKNVAIAITIAACCVLAACGTEGESTVGTMTSELGVPADGNGNKQVISNTGTSPIDCGTETITFRFVSWAQFRTFPQARNRNVELDVFHAELTFTNAAGDMFRWLDVGPDHYYVQDGSLFVSVTGTSTASGNIDRSLTVIGHVVLNLSTGEVIFVAGNEKPNIFDLACDELT